MLFGAESHAGGEILLDGQPSTSPPQEAKQTGPGADP